VLGDVGGRPWRLDLDQRSGADVVGTTSRSRRRALSNAAAGAEPGVIRDLVRGETGSTPTGRSATKNHVEKRRGMKTGGREMWRSGRGSTPRPGEADLLVDLCGPPPDAARRGIRRRRRCRRGSSTPRPRDRVIGIDPAAGEDVQPGPNAMVAGAG
jgi:hypothetical protein